MATTGLSNNNRYTDNTIADSSSSHPRPGQDLKTLGALRTFKTHHYFDFVSGTSTGGLSAIMLSRLKMDIDDALAQYEVFGNEVFSHPRTSHVGRLRRAKYPTAKIEQTIKSILSGWSNAEGARSNRAQPVMKNDNPHACHTAVVATGGDPAIKPYIFRSYDHPQPSQQDSTKDAGDHMNAGPAHNVKLLKVARATSAAPGYFRKVDINGVDFIDGGLGANNSAERAFNDIRQIYSRRPPVLVISIGTGLKSPDQSDGHHVTKSPTPGKKRRQLFHQVRDVLQALNIAKEYVTESEETHSHLKELMERDCQAAFPERTLQYFRFNVRGIDHVKLDDWCPKGNGETTKKPLSEETCKYLRQPDVRNRLIKCAVALVQARRARAETEHWEQYATETVYECCFDRDNDNPGTPDIPQHARKCATLPFRSRGELRQHAFECHSFVQHVTDEEQEQGPHSTIASSAACILADDPYLCTLDDCGTKVRRYATREGFFTHLVDVHGLKQPVVKTAEELEAWLDRGRTTDIAKVERARSDPTKKMKDSHNEGPASFFRSRWPFWRRHSRGR